MILFPALYLLSVISIVALGHPAPRAAQRASRVTLPLTTRFHFDSGAKVPYRARAAAHIERTLQRSQKRLLAVNSSVPLHSENFNFFAVPLAAIALGSPPTNYTVVINTGTSNTWLGANPNHPYVQTNTTIFTGDFMNFSFADRFVSGKEFLDQLALSPDLIITNQSIGAASSSDFPPGIGDGILGLGPTNQTVGILNGSASGNTIPTVIDNLFAQGEIISRAFGISLEPAAPDGTINGEITFGSSNRDGFIGDLYFSFLTSTPPASKHWGIDQSVTYGTDTPLLNLTAGIIDTGTSLLLLASDAFQTYQSLTGAVMDNTTGLLTITDEQFSNLESLFFHINGTDFEFNADAQLLPRAMIPTGGNNATRYLVVADLGANSGVGLDFVNGCVFLQRFYTLFDSNNGRIGFGTTKFTNATTNNMQMQ